MVSNTVVRMDFSLVLQSLHLAAVLPLTGPSLVEMQTPLTFRKFMLTVKLEAKGDVQQLDESSKNLYSEYVIN